ESLVHRFARGTAAGEQMSRNFNTATNQAYRKSLLSKTAGIYLIFQKNRTGFSRGGDMNVIPNVLQRYTRTNWETSKGPTTHDIFMVVTPKVREEARRHFNCSTLEGAEIENQGGSGTAWSHWEKRVFENEAMSGMATQVYALSRLTLALFEDSGWYKVNYDKAESMPWGRNLGCTFAKQSCLTWMKSNRRDPYPFCTVYEETRCSTSRKAKVRCNMLADSGSIPREYNYNIKNLYRDKKGRSIIGYGSVTLADFCPYYKIYGDVSREDSDTRCTYHDNKHYNNYSLEDKDKGNITQVFSPTARCFELDGGIKVRSESGTITWLHSVGCYETICKDGRLMIKTQKSKFYPCYQEGQFIHVEKRIHGVGTVTTRIVCPSCTELCGP
ncbi:Leishmanolysin, partial [Trichostrongylus colubriformis]